MNSAQGKRSNRWLDSIPYVIMAVVGLILLVLFVSIFGYVRGEEFSPEAFARREYSFYRIPFTSIQIRPTRHRSTSNFLERRIASDLKVVSTGHPTAKWDIVHSRQAQWEPYEGDAKILSDYLSLRNADGDLIWNIWTNEHQELADILWPTIADVAKARLYVLIPDILDIAANPVTPDQLKNDLQALIEREALEIAAKLQENEQHEFAIRAFDLALLYGQNPTEKAHKSREKSKQEVLSAGGTPQQLMPATPTELESSFTDDEGEERNEPEVTEEDFEGVESESGDADENKE